MVRVCKSQKESVLAMVRKGKLDAASLSTSNLVDEIILAMSKRGVLDCLSAGVPDRRAHNTTVPFDLILASSIAAKMTPTAYIRALCVRVPFGTLLKCTQAMTL